MTKQGSGKTTKKARAAKTFRPERVLHLVNRVEGNDPAQADPSIEDFGRARTPAVRRKTTARPSTKTLSVYLQEMGVTPLLEDAEELSLARELQEGREGIAKLALKLPDSVKEFLLEDDLDGPEGGRHWPFKNLDTFFEKFKRYAHECGDEQIRKLFLLARGHKKHLDHARDGLILANLRLVVHLAKKYVNNGLQFMDLIQEGNLGLLKAVEKFEHERGHKFSTYAYWWIKQAIERSISDKARIIRVPVHVAEKIKKVGRVARELEEISGRKPTPQEIAKKIGVLAWEVESTLGIVREPLSLDASAGEEGDGSAAKNRLVDPDLVTPFQSVAQSEMEERVELALRELSPREEEIIRMRFGIGYDSQRTLDEVGVHLRLSRERVRQIEGLALEKIKASPLSHDLAELFGVVEGSAPTKPSSRRRCVRRSSK